MIEATPTLPAGLDSPAPDEVIYDRALFLSGWIYAPGRAASPCRIRAYLDETYCAETHTLFPRADISERFQLERIVPSGFRMLGQLQPPLQGPRDSVLRITVSWNEENPLTIIEQPVRLVPALLEARPYGELVYPANETLLHRENIYGSGPPLEEPGIEVANLLRSYLPAGSSVVDVGCGAGAYGPGLIAAGHRWLGLEVDAHCCDILRRRQLPFRRVTPESGTLPGADGEWDCAICVEVLEHVREPEIFLREIARMTRGRVLFSVPNLEVLPYFYGWQAAPWHLLEADHKNFFTRASLRALLEKHFRRVEIFPYGQHPLRTREDVALYMHFCAVAESPDLVA